MEQAERDLAQARHAASGMFYEWACFSAQQAVEKAVFQKMGGEAWGHSVADLMRLLAGSDDEAYELPDEAFELDKAYIAARYPDAHPSGAPGRRYTKKEAVRHIAHAEQIVRYCKDRLSTI